MKKPPNISFIIFLILAIILFDIYYQLAQTKGNLWESEWLLRRIFILSAFVLVVILYFSIKKLIRSKQRQELFSKQLMNSQEQSRKAIASELHDSLGQNLLVVNNKILQILSSNRLQSAGGGVSEDLKELSGLVTDSIEEVRRISYNLYPHQIEKLGLTSAVKSMLNIFSDSTNIEFDCEIDNVDNVLSKENEINFFRIIQEAVNNIVKHSYAVKAALRVRKTPVLITVNITDNGKGFDTTHLYQGLGLANIYERTRLLKGTIKLESGIKKGTSIMVYVPIK